MTQAVYQILQNCTTLYVWVAMQIDIEFCIHTYTQLHFGLYMYVVTYNHSPTSFTHRCRITHITLQHTVFAQLPTYIATHPTQHVYQWHYQYTHTIVDTVQFNYKHYSSQHQCIDSWSVVNLYMDMWDFIFMSLSCIMQCIWTVYHMERNFGGTNILPIAC